MVENNKILVQWIYKEYGQRFGKMAEAIVGEKLLEKKLIADSRTELWNLLGGQIPDVDGRHPRDDSLLRFKNNQGIAALARPLGMNKNKILIVLSIIMLWKMIKKRKMMIL